MRARGKVAVIAGFSLLWSKDVANPLNLYRKGAVGFIDWLGLRVTRNMRVERWSEGIGTDKYTNYPTAGLERILNANPRIESQLRWK
jgi:hypothetical protein